MAERPGNFLRSPKQVLEPVHPSPPPTHYALQEVSAEPAWEHPCSVMGLGVSSVGGRFEVQLGTLPDPLAMSVLCLGPLSLLGCD